MVREEFDDEYFMRQALKEAAIALGESRMPEAWLALRDAFAGSAIPSAILLGMSLLLLFRPSMKKFVPLRAEHAH